LIKTSLLRITGFVAQARPTVYRSRIALTLASRARLKAKVNASADAATFAARPQMMAQNDTASIAAAKNSAQCTADRGHPRDPHCHGDSDATSEINFWGWISRPL
jgi:hypothetical protein